MPDNAFQETAFPETNFLNLELRDADPGRAGVIILPVPYEKTSTFGTGSARGPGEIIRASSEVELFDAVLGSETCRRIGGIATAAPVTLAPAEANGEVLCHRLESEVAAWLKQGRTVVTLGGEHSSVVGAIRAHGRAAAAAGEPLTVIQFDAHSDLRETYLDDPWNHACAMARVLDACDHLVQVGIRSQAAEERDRSERDAIPVHYAHAIHGAETGGMDWIDAIIQQCRDTVYITFDCDAFDPSIIPATGTPEPGGLTWHQVDRFVDLLTRQRRLAGFDISELAPIPGLHHCQFTLAKLIYRWLGYMHR
ncbi:MAG TPA: agmatinase [bacterium]|nr:agmatinase [bacterium]